MFFKSILFSKGTPPCFTHRKEIRASKIKLCAVSLAALDKIDTETDAIVNALIAHIGTNSSCKMGADELLLLVNRHPRLQPERSTINRYMDAFPELKETTLSACQNINRKTLSRLQTFLAPLEYARRFANTKGAHRH